MQDIYPKEGTAERNDVSAILFTRLDTVHSFCEALLRLSGGKFLKITRIISTKVKLGHGFSVFTSASYMYKSIRSSFSAFDVLYGFVLCSFMEC